MSIVLIFVACMAIDGDTLKCDYERGGVTDRIRLWGIDSAEKGEEGHNKAKSMMRSLIHQQRLVCRPPVGRSKFSRDRYGRIVARCFVRKRDIAISMVCLKLAKDWLRYSKGYYQRIRCAK